MRSQRAIALMLVLVGSTGCHAPQPSPLLAIGAPFPAELQGPVNFEFALYPTSEGQEDPVEVIERLAAKNPRLHLSHAEDATLPAFHAATVTTDQYGPQLSPPPEHATAHLEPDERAKLGAVKRVTFVTFRGAVGDGALVGEATTLMHDAATAIGALILDSETDEFFSPAELAAARIATPKLASEVVVRISGKRIITAGMGKLGLPDVLIEDARVVQDPARAHALVEAVAERIHSQPQLQSTGKLEVNVPNEARELAETGTLEVKVGARNEDDAQNRVLQLILPARAAP